MTDATGSGIPTGPIDREPLDYPTADYPTAGDREAILREVLAAAGVTAGEYDDRIVRWFAGFADWGTFATMTSWVQRAAQTPEE
jgi:hypothetical protein